MLSNHERISKALDALRQGLYPYLEQKMKADYGDSWISNATSHLRDYQKAKQKTENVMQEDISALLTVLARDRVFKKKQGLSHPDLALVSELLEIRNQWAHKSTFSTEDTYRAIDTALRLLKAVESPQVADVEKQRQQVFRLLSQEQSGHEIKAVLAPSEEKRVRQELEELLKRLPFENVALLNQALTHTSYKYENPNTGGDNERLEFIGDALLTFLSGDFIYRRNPELTERDMTILRSNLVDNTQLAKFASALDLGKWMRLGKGEVASGGHQKPSLLSNTFEAVIGAYYLDSGIDAVRDLIDALLEGFINDLPITEKYSPKISENEKGLLQQTVLDPDFSDNPGHEPPQYKTTRSGGEDHAPLFTSVVYVAGRKYGEGRDRNKKEAEKQAAKDALRKLGLM